MEPQTSAPVTTATPPPAAAAPAPATPDTQGAVQAAVKAGDTQAYRLARRAERAGKPMDAVPVVAESPKPAEAGTVAAPAAPAKAEPPRRGRDEDYISNRIREGVDRGTAELRAEIDRLKQRYQAHPPAEARREAEKPYDGTDPSDPRPNVAQFQTLEEYEDARDEWHDRRIGRKQARAAEGAKVATAREELTTAQRARAEKFIGQLDSAKAADPEFVGKLTPDVLALKPFDALIPGEAGGPANVVAEQVFDSPMAPQVLLHFSQHPDALARLTAMPPEIQAMPATVRTARHIQWIVKEFGKLEAALSAPPAEPKAEPQAEPRHHITKAPPQAQTLGTRPAAAVDPKAAAVKSGNTSAYRQLRRRERAEAMGRR